MALNREDVDNVIHGQLPLDPPNHVIPEDLLLFAPPEVSPNDPIGFWFNVDSVGLEKYLAHTRNELTEERFEFHCLVAHYANLVLPYLLQRYDYENRKVVHDVNSHSTLHVALNKTSRTLSFVHPDARVKALRFDIVPPRKKPLAKTTTAGLSDRRDSPTMPMRIAVPFLEVINGLFIQKFEKDELPHLVHRLTGYSLENVSRYWVAKLSPVDRNELIGALEGIIRSIKDS